MPRGSFLRGLGMGQSGTQFFQIFNFSLTKHAYKFYWLFYRVPHRYSALYPGYLLAGYHCCTRVLLPVQYPGEAPPPHHY